MITRLAPEMDPVLHDILRDGIQKYLSGEIQTKYVVNWKTGDTGKSRRIRQILVGTTCLEGHTSSIREEYNNNTNKKNQKQENYYNPIHEMWLKRNKDSLNPLQEQQRMAKLTEAI